MFVHVYVNGEEIQATPSHPFYVPKFGWTKAINLRAGDILVLSNGEYVVVEAIQHEILEAPIKVYNFEVEDYHTYFVGESCVLVHNDCTDFYKTGQKGEKASGLTKNTEHIESLSNTANYRIPDGLDKKNMILSEVKNVSKQSYTKQLKDFVDYSKKYGYKFELYVRKTTQFTKKVQKLIDAGDIIIKYLPW